MAYDNEGEFYFDPRVDQDDQEALEEVDKLEAARVYRGRQMFAQHQQGAFSNGIQQALQEFGISPDDFERLAAGNPHATASINAASGYNIARSVIQGAMSEVPRPRDANGRFVSGPPRGGKQPRKSAAEYRNQVQESGKISGDSDEAVRVLEALLSQ